jgi:hypothetical protein
LYNKMTTSSKSTQSTVISVKQSTARLGVQGGVQIAARSSASRRGPNETKQRALSEYAAENFASTSPQMHGPEGKGKHRTVPTEIGQHLPANRFRSNSQTNARTAQPKFRQRFAPDALARRPNDMRERFVRHVRAKRLLPIEQRRKSGCSSRTTNASEIAVKHSAKIQAARRRCAANNKATGAGLSAMRQSRHCYLGTGQHRTQGDQADGVLTRSAVRTQMHARAASSTTLDSSPAAVTWQVKADSQSQYCVGIVRHKPDACKVQRYARIARKLCRARVCKEIFEKTCLAEEARENLARSEREHVKARTVQRRERDLNRFAKRKDVPRCGGPTEYPWKQIAGC